MGVKYRFSDSQRTALDELGFEFSYDLASEVAYQQHYNKQGLYVVICADGDVYTVQTDDIVRALGFG
jgi:hypothetical protein